MDVTLLATSHEALTEEIRFATALPPPSLARWIEVIWYSRGELEDRAELVLPCAAGDVVTNLGDPIVLEQNGETLNVVGSTASGLASAPFRLEHPEVHEAVGMRLTPLGIRAVLGVPASALLDRCVALSDLTGETGDELAERLTRAGGGVAAIETMARWARDRIRRLDAEPDPVAGWAVGELEDSAGGLSIAELQKRSGYGATRFNARFRDELGLTPKHFARLVRFRRVLDELDPRIPLIELALSLGFADQAHMNAEFRRIAGVTPSDVLAARYASGTTLAESALGGTPIGE